MYNCSLRVSIDLSIVPEERLGFLVNSYL